MNKAGSFTQLIVWQKAMDAAMQVFTKTKSFPSDERFSLIDQVRRSSRSVAANIAEAWRKRRYPAAWISKLSDAEAEAAETQTHIEIARRCKYLSSEEANCLISIYNEILAMLESMASNANQWSRQARNTVVAKE